MNQMLKLDFEGRPVRMVGMDGEPWWLLADVCGVLAVSNPRQAASYLDDDERRKLDFAAVTTSDGSKINDLADGMNKEAWFVNEAGLYSLILRSRKPEAKRFKRWVTHEVLPSIRQTGGYEAPSARVELSHAALQEVARIAVQAATEAATTVCRTFFAELRPLMGPAAYAKAEEYRPARVAEDGVMVAELVARLELPGLVNRRSVAGRLTSRLMNHFAGSGHPVQLRSGVRFFPRVTSIELAQTWRAELIAAAKRDKRQAQLKLVLDEPAPAADPAGA